MRLIGVLSSPAHISASRGGGGGGVLGNMETTVATPLTDTDSSQLQAMCSNYNKCNCLQGRDRPTGTLVNQGDNIVFGIGDKVNVQYFGYNRLNKPFFYIQPTDRFR